ncbi:MAG: hypothetical protein JXB14_03550 [Candidatus Altiarchaeota archaeon]|nr:hypothetical protein [Candidatus Altiarchaeota archaeon]
MASLALVDMEVNVCEACMRVMDVGEEYEAKCRFCGADVCKNCAVEGTCLKCLNGW